MNDPMNEADTDIESEVLNQDSEAAWVPPDPANLPSEARCELYYIPEYSGIDSHGNWVSD